MQCIARTKNFERCRNHTEPWSLFCRRHRWWWLISLLGAVITITTIGANIAQMFGVTFSLPHKPTVTNMPDETLTPTLISTNTPVDISTSTLTVTLSPVPSQTVFFDPNTYHIGDTVEWLT